MGLPHLLAMILSVILACSSGGVWCLELDYQLNETGMIRQTSCHQSSIHRFILTFDWIRYHDWTPERSQCHAIRSAITGFKWKLPLGVPYDSKSQGSSKFIRAQCNDSEGSTGTSRAVAVDAIGSWERNRGNQKNDEGNVYVIMLQCAPLSLLEIQTALAIDPKDDELDSSKIPFKPIILRLCSPLIEYRAEEMSFGLFICLFATTFSIRPLYSSKDEQTPSFTSNASFSH